MRNIRNNTQAGTAHAPAIAKQECSRPKHLRFGTNPSIIIVPYGLFMGIGFAALVFICLSFGAPSHQGIQLLSSALNLTLISAVFFSRLMSAIMEDGPAALMTKPLRTLLRPGFWLHGGLFGATVGGLLAFQLGYVEDFSMFAGSLSMGLPLYETFSRIGCHTYGCCYGRIAESSNGEPSLSPAASQRLWRLFPFPVVRYGHPSHYAVTRIDPSLLHKPLIPIQLISATLFLLLFLAISLPLAHYTCVEIAGSTTLICHAAVRLITETYRADYRGRENWWLSMTGKMAIIQAIGGIIWLVNTVITNECTPPRLEAPEHVKEGYALAKSLLSAVTLGVLVYGTHVDEIGSWVGDKGNPASGIRT